ncbi:MAG: hypothetical protein Q9227_005157 [Pyrenula ochraceoflavens]
MPAKSRFTRLDAFTKTVEDARVRTTSGGIVTIVSLLVVFYLVWGEWTDYRKVSVLPELMVDKGRGEKMEIHLNITFPRIPCELLTLDVMDVSGEQQTGVVHGVSKVRLSSYTEGGRVIESSSLDLHAEEAAKHLDPTYCGSCYSAPAPPNAKKPGCCNTCDEVREAYASNSWAFGRGEGVEQCEKEGYGERLDAQRKEGCRIEGGIRVNKVIGNFHIAPGRSFSNGNLHVHDLNNYLDTPVHHTFSHQIHQLRFGPQLPDDIAAKWTDHHHTNPLDDTEQSTDEPAFNFMYFIKVVSTSYLPLGWTEKRSTDSHSILPTDLVPLGLHGQTLGSEGSIETHQYSVTSHKRSLSGGDDAEEGHKERLHAQGGIPGIFFSYDISPMKVLNKEQRPKSFTAFLTGVCAVIGDNYDPITHLNAIFSHPSTLSSVSRTYSEIESYQDQLDDEIDGLLDEQRTSNQEAVERIQASKDELAELFKKIEDVRERAAQTQRNIAEMTADIKQLDNTKKNLTLSMTALKRLQMLTTAYEQLKVLSKTRQYRECAQLLQAVIQLMAHFKSYRSIDQIATLSRNVSDLQRELLEQVCEDFEITFAKGEVSQRRGVLAEGCHVMDALGENARSRLVTWYCNTQLREYRTVFRGNEEAGSLDNISRRYSWFRRMLKVYDEEHAAIFPPYWKVGEVLANVFCEGTRDDFKGILSRTTKSGQTVDVNLLLLCLQETLDFEHSLERRFTTNSRTSIDTVTSGSDATGFNQTISDAFEPYLSVWVDAQDKQLSSMIPKYKQQPPKNPEEDFNSQTVISSSTELFNFYRQSLNQCAKLSTGQPLSDLSKMFAKYLEQYAQQVLLFYISEKPSAGTPSRVPSIEDTILVLNTADYCYNTSNALEEKIKGRIDEGYKSSVDLQTQADTFMGIASAAVRSLVRRVEVDLEPCWREMRNIAWNKMENVLDQSSYVAEVQRKVRERTSQIVDLLHKQQYARAFADNFVELLANAYISNIVQCKPITEVGAEQMLLDTHAIRSTVLQILSPAPPAFTKRVTSAFAKIETLLKTLQVVPSPPESLITAYLIHIADLSDANFRKLLELKGIRGRNEQNQLVELFQMHKLGAQYKSSLVEKSSILTPLNVTGGGGGLSTSASSTLGPSAAVHGLGAISSSAAASLSTANLPGNMKFDAAGFGNALMDRFSSPSLGGIGTPREGSGAVTPPPDGMLPSSGAAGEAGAKLNENLRNIGKFFKRDLGGFGGRFGKGNSGEDGR